MNHAYKYTKLKFKSTIHSLQQNMEEIIAAEVYGWKQGRKIPIVEVVARILVWYKTQPNRNMVGRIDFLLINTDGHQRQSMLDFLKLELYHTWLYWWKKSVIEIKEVKIVSLRMDSNIKSFLRASTAIDLHLNAFFSFHRLLASKSSTQFVWILPMKWC